jgi:hypothetical protein
MVSLCAMACAGGLFAAETLADMQPGSQIRVRLGQTISSSQAKSGDTWSGTLESNVKVNGKTVARKGDPVEGKVVTAKASGRLSGTAVLELQLTSINGQPVSTETVGSQGGGHKGRDAGAIGGGAAAGAIIGALAGGGKGAAIGAGSGAAVGTAGAAATGKKDISYNVESILTFTTR